MNRLVWSVLTLLAALRCFADSPEAAFDAANKLYAQNKFTEAAAAYEKIAVSNGVSPALLFNLGNARFKAGEIGRAIVAYSRAAEISPRDADLRANLQFVRSQVQSPTWRQGAIERGLDVLSVNEWTGLFAGAVWVGLGLLATRQLRPALAPSLRNWTLLAAATTIVVGCALGYQAHAKLGRSVAVVIARECSVRSSPLDDAPPAFTAHDGAQFLVLDLKNDWLQVSDGARLFGWIKREQVDSVRPLR